MKPDKLFEDRVLDLRELWRELGKEPPGPILPAPPTTHSPKSVKSRRHRSAA